jgi:hypothetical protein
MQKDHFLLYIEFEFFKLQLFFLCLKCNKKIIHMRITYTKGSE